MFTQYQAVSWVPALCGWTGGSPEKREFFQGIMDWMDHTPISANYSHSTMGNSSRLLSCSTSRQDASLLQVNLWLLRGEGVLPGDSGLDE